MAVLTMMVQYFYYKMKQIIIDSEYDLKSIKQYSIYVNNLPKNIKRSELKEFFENLVIKGHKLKVC